MERQTTIQTANTANSRNQNATIALCVCGKRGRKMGGGAGKMGAWKNEKEGVLKRGRGLLLLLLMAGGCPSTKLTLHLPLAAAGSVFLRRMLILASRFPRSHFLLPLSPTPHPFISAPSGFSLPSFFS